MGQRRSTHWVRGAPSDVLHAVVAVGTLLVVLLMGGLFDRVVVGAVADLLAGLERLPRWFVSAIATAGAVLSVGLLLAGAVVALTGRHWRLLANAVVAAGAAAGATAVTNRLVDAAEAVTPTADSILVADRVPSAVLLAAATAVVTVTVTSLPRLWRRLAWLAVLALLFLRFLGAPVSFDALLAVLVGWAVGAVAVVVLGAPSRRPTASSVVDGLAAVGVRLDSLSAASVDARGSTPYFGTATDGTRYFVKVLGEDERSADLLFRLWRFLQPRDLGDQRPFSSLRRGVEHEALVATMARQFGIRTPVVAGFAVAHPNGCVLVYEAIQGRSLDEVEPEELTDDVLAQAWAQLAELRRHRIAHRDLRLANLFLGADGSVSIIDFGFSELAAEDLLLQTDVAELLASSASVVGVHRAVRVAVDAVGAAAVDGAAARLTPSRLSGATRTAMKAMPGVLEELRDACHRANSGPEVTRGGT